MVFFGQLVLTYLLEGIHITQVLKSHCLPIFRQAVFSGEEPKVNNMAIEFTAVEQDLVERQTSVRKSGNSGVLAARRDLWRELGESLQSLFQKQFDKMAVGKLPTIDIEQLSVAFNMQQGALKNKLKGYAVTIRFVRNVPKVSVKWISDKEEAKAFIKSINAQDLDKGPRLLGGLNLTRSIIWNGKSYPVTSNADYKRDGEVSKRFYVLSIGKYWRSGSPTNRSN